MHGTRKLLIVPLLIASLLVPLRQPHASAASTYQTSLAAIAWASRKWNVSYWWLYRVAQCESGFDPNAVNPYSGTVGLYQFEWGTWYSYARQIGEWRSPFNPYAAANVASYMFAQGQAYQWVCR